MSIVDSIINNNINNNNKRGSKNKRKVKVRDHDSISVQNDRGHWGSRAEFLLVCLGYSVGLGNFWRFPYYAFEYGGGAFMIPYLILLFVIGRPMYLMEVSFGQYSQLGALHTWRRATPLMAGFGYTTILRTLAGGPAYMVIISYSLHFLFNSAASIGGTLPWSVCPKGAASDPDCYEVGKEIPCSFYAKSNFTPSHCTDATQGSAQYYWRNEVLQIANEGFTTFGDMGGIVWGMLLSLIVSWVITGLCLLQGIKTSGKVVYFTATFPFLAMIILMIAGVRLEGAGKGLYFLFVPKWEKLLDVHVWRVALEQVLGSLSLGGGGLLSFGSYNDFNQKVHIDVMILSVMDLVASLLCSITIFSVLGAMAHDLKLDSIDEIVSVGPGLAFVAYPEAISRTMPMPQVFSLIFFLMVFLLGLDSMFGIVEVILTSVFDEYPNTRKYKPLVVLLTCSTMFLTGIPYCTQKGQFLFDLMDKFLAGVGSLFSCFASLVALHWVYGVNNFAKDLHFMLGYTPSIVMKVIWAVISPITLMILFIGSLVSWKWPLYAGSIPYPTWAYVTVAAVPLIVLAPLVIMALLHVMNKVAAGKWRTILKPSNSWGPGCPVARERLREMKRQERLQKMQMETSQQKKGDVNSAFEMAEV